METRLEVERSKMCSQGVIMDDSWLIDAVERLKRKEKREKKEKKASRKNAFLNQYSTLGEKEEEEEEEEESDFHSEIEEGLYSSILNSSGECRLTNRRAAVCEKNITERMLVKESLRRFLQNQNYNNLL